MTGLKAGGPGEPSGPGLEDGFRLSILLVTYNHEKFLHRALDALVGQVVQGRVEVVVADDGSTDRSMEIIREYALRDASLTFSFLDNSANLGVTKNYQRGFAACSGAYVAVLEGDDYWTSPWKLQRQCDFLDAHRECDICAANYFVYEQERACFYPRTGIGGGHRFITARDLIADNLIGNFSTTVYRKSALQRLPADLFSIKSYDWIVNICIARESLIGFLEEPMSVYRVHESGLWSKNTLTEKMKEQLELIAAYDKLTNNIFSPEFESLAEKLQSRIRREALTSRVAKGSDFLMRAATALPDYVPPIFTALARALLPPKILRTLERVLQKAFK